MTARVPEKQRRALSLSVDEALKDLEIDGYKVVFTARVALLPVDLAGPRPAEGDD